MGRLHCNFGSEHCFLKGGRSKVFGIWKLLNLKLWGSSLLHENFYPPWLPTAPSSWSLGPGQAKCHGNGPKWYSNPKNHGFDTKNKCLAWSEPKLKFHYLKSSLDSYCNSLVILFLASIVYIDLKLIKVVPKDTQLTKIKSRSSMFSSEPKFQFHSLKSSLASYSTLLPYLGLLVELRLIKSIRNNLPYQKTLGLTR